VVVGAVDSVGVAVAEPAVVRAVAVAEPAVVRAVAVAEEPALAWAASSFGGGRA